MGNLIKGAVFFSCFLPSFTNIGYKSRRLWWPKENWDFSGQTWVVTGATSGIGLSIAQEAYNAGAQVHVISRSPDKLAALATTIDPNVITHQVDLSIMQAVHDIAQQLPQVDVLVNNVGLMLNEYQQTPEGLEQSFATNVLGHYILTETLRNNGHLQNGTVINMSSGGMYNVPMTLDRLQGGEGYDGMLTYAYQKRAQVLLNSWWRKQGLNSYVMHPGWVDTPGVETAMPDFYKMTKNVLREPQAGSDTTLWLAAKQPDQLHPRGIWFDRGLRSDHYFSDTRTGADEDQLIEYLEAARTGTDAKVANVA